MIFKLRNLAFLFLLLPIMANAQSASERYRTDTRSDKNTLDIYSFSGATNAPVMIYVHGGAWTIGDKSSVADKPRYFNRKGYVFISVNYHLVPDVAVENQFDDIDHALRWIADNISRYGGDPTNLHLMGHSAGAHLVANAAVNPGPLSAPLIRNGSVRTVISNDTRSYDIPALAAETRGRLPRMMGRVFGSDPARWHALSPIYNIKRGRKPAFLILWSGQGDGESRGVFANNFAAALVNARTTASVFDGDRYNHRDINRNIGRPGDITATIDQFLSQYD